ncbi:MAG: acyl carrier protein [Armatimonadota bacterium]
MHQDEIFKKTCEIIAERVDVNADMITLESRFDEDLLADSLEKVEVVMGLEEAFDTEIPDDELDSLKTVGDLVRLIASKVKEPV